MLKAKDIFSADHYLKVDHGLVHYKSQPSVRQLHRGWSFSDFERFEKGHSMHGN